MNSNNSDEYFVFDVYNPAYKHGGMLYMSLLNVYNKNKNDGSYSVPGRGSKYWRRRNMAGVTFKSAVVVSLRRKTN